MVESFFVQVGWALLSTWAQINGWAAGDKSAGIGNTVNLDRTMLSRAISQVFFVTGTCKEKYLTRELLSMAKIACRFSHA
jgi:hypothetical protein